MNVPKNFFPKNSSKIKTLAPNKKANYDLLAKYPATLVPWCLILILACLKTISWAQTTAEAKIATICIDHDPWYLTYRAGGSATISYGDGGHDSPNTEIGAYDLAALARKIAPLLKAESTSNITVSISDFNGINLQSAPKYLDEETFLELFSEVLHRAHVTNVPRIRAMLQYRPLFLKGKQLDISEDQTANWQRVVVARQLQGEFGGDSAPRSSGSDNYILIGMEPPGISAWRRSEVWWILGITASLLIAIALIFRRIRKSRRTADV